jgi:hypothetical protein
MVLYLCVLIVFSLRQESLKLILVTNPSPRWFCHNHLARPDVRHLNGDGILLCGTNTWHLHYRHHHRSSTGNRDRRGATPVTTSPLFNSGQKQGKREQRKMATNTMCVPKGHQQERPRVGPLGQELHTPGA